MIEAVLVVLTKAQPGRDADLDDWYTNSISAMPCAFAAP